MIPIRLWACINEGEMGKWGGEEIQGKAWRKWGVDRTTGFEPGQQTWHKQNTHTRTHPPKIIANESGKEKMQQELGKAFPGQEKM